MVLALLLVVSTLTADADARFASWRELPHGACRFAQDQFGFTPEPFQEETLIAFANPDIQRISLQACAGPGKTAVMSVCAWYFLATRCTWQDGGFEHPRALATSITKENLDGNLWPELAKWQQRSPYLRETFRHTHGRIFAVDHPETWFLDARAWPKTGSAEDQGRTFSGLHGQNVAVFIDESGNIPPTVLRAGEQMLSTRPAFGKLFQSGNPSSLEGMLHEAANRLREQWFIVIITGDPDDPKRATRIDVDWARQQIATYGRDNPWVMSFILGKFPPSSLNTLLGIEDVQAAMARELQVHQFEHLQKRLGVDVARFGDDRTVIWPRQGMQSFRPVIMRGARTTEIAARVMAAKLKWHSELELIDDTGHWGHGVIDQLETTGIHPHPVVFHAPAIDPRFKNRRAEMWITMADAIKGGAALPMIGEMIPELTTVTYTFNNGVFQLEDKDMVKKRIGRSPDLADALALTYALPDLPSGLAARPGSGRPGAATIGHAATEYEPDYGGGQ